MELTSSHDITAFGNGGRYFSNTAGVIKFVYGPPVDVLRFTLNQDKPIWERVDPRHVSFHLRSLRKQVFQKKRIQEKELRGLHNLDLMDLFSIETRYIRDQQWLLEMIGKRLCRYVSRVPMSANPYLLIWIGQRVHGFTQLLEKSPMLSIIIANYPESNPLEISIDDLLLACREEVLMPRRELLSNRNIPSEAITGMCKINTSGADPTCIKALSRTLQDSIIRKRFNHTAEIGPDGIRLFADEQLLRRVTGRFLRLLVGYDRKQCRPKYAPMLKTAIEILEYGDSKLCRKQFNSPDQLAEWYYKTCDQLMLRKFEEARYLQFRLAPIDDIPGLIEQIKTGEQLLREALLMEHCCCCQEYIDRLSNGHCFLYSVGGGGLQRCTIEVEPISNENIVARYAITQVAGKMNSTVCARTLSAINIWAEDQKLQMCVAVPEVYKEQLEFPGFLL